MTATTLTHELERLNELRTAATLKATEADELKREADKLEYELFERMAGEGIGSIKVNGTNFVRAETQYGQVQDRSEFIKWAEVNSPELLEMKERKKLVNEIVRERLDSGEILPPGLGFYTKAYISRRAG